MQTQLLLDSEQPQERRGDFLKLSARGAEVVAAAAPLLNGHGASVAGA